MNTIQDNTNFIKIIYETGNTRDIKKKFVNEIQMDEDTDSLFIDLVGKGDLSLKYFEYGKIADPEYAYDTLLDFYNDFYSLLNYNNPETIYPGDNLSNIFYQETEGQDLLDRKNNIVIPYVSGAGLDQIFDFSVLNDDRFDKGATVGNALGLPEYYNDPLNAYFYYDGTSETTRRYWKLKDFHYFYIQQQSDITPRLFNNEFFLKATATTNTSNVIDTIDSLFIYENSLTGGNLSKMRNYIGIQDDFYGDNILINSGAGNTTDWVDSNSDGLADDWFTILSPITSIVSGNGFTGNAQRIEASGANTAVLYITGIAAEIGKQYKISFKYRTNSTNFIVFWSNDLIIAQPEPNEGDAIYYETISTCINPSIRFYSNNNGEGKWIELDEIKAEEVFINYYK